MSDTRPQQFPNDAAALKHFTQLELSTTPTSEADFAHLLSSNYHSLVPTWSQSIRGLKDTVNLEGAALRRANSSNEKQFQRYMDGSINIPLELMSPWLESLSEYRNDAVVALYHIGNLLPMKVPCHSVVLNVSTASHQYGDFLRSMAPILADSLLDDKDKPFIPEALQQVNQLITALGSIRFSMLSVINGDDAQDPSSIDNNLTLTDKGRRQ